MQNRELIYEGKAKQLFRDPDHDGLMMVFKNDATAFNGDKFAQFEGKGRINKQLTSALFQKLEEEGIPTHFLEDVDEITLRVREVEIVPLEVVVRNVVAGSLAERTGEEEGTPLPRPIVEFFYKRDDLNDPLLNRQHIGVLELATEEELETLQELALRINEILTRIFDRRGLNLIDFKLEFGRDRQGRILLADEISPDTCRLWDQQSGERLDKDRFRRDLGDLIEGYEEVLERMQP